MPFPLLPSIVGGLIVYAITKAPATTQSSSGLSSSDASLLSQLSALMKNSTSSGSSKGGGGGGGSLGGGSGGSSGGGSSSGGSSAGNGDLTGDGQTATGAFDSWLESLGFNGVSDGVNLSTEGTAAEGNLGYIDSVQTPTLDLPEVNYPGDSGPGGYSGDTWDGFDTGDLNDYVDED